MMTPSPLTSCFPALAELDPASAVLLTGAAREVMLPAQTPVFSEGSPCQNYLLVLEGSVCVRKTSDTGREIVLYRVEKGQACVLTTSCLMAREDYSAEAYTETQVRAISLPAATFRALLARSEVFRDFVFQVYGTRLSDLLMLIEEVAFSRIDMRLAHFLVQQADSSGEIRATHQSLAAELGTAREVISRQLKEFERRNWVELHRGSLIVKDRDALSAMAGRD